MTKDIEELIEYIRCNYTKRFDYHKALEIIEALKAQGETEDVPEVEKPFDVLQHLRDGGKAKLPEWNSGVYVWLHENGDLSTQDNRTFNAVRLINGIGWQPYEPLKTKPSINWDHVVPELKWLAVQQNGQAWLYSIEPEFDKEYGSWTHGKHNKIISASGFVSFNRGDCPWDESLVMRPEGEE